MSGSLNHESVESIDEIYPTETGVQTITAFPETEQEGIDPYFSPFDIKYTGVICTAVRAPKQEKDKNIEENTNSILSSLSVNHCAILAESRRH